MRALFIKILACLGVMLLPVLACAQGNIFGVVNNSDMSSPDTADLDFIGYLDSTDEEIKIENCDGTGFDMLNDSTVWYDQFQNYLTEAPGIPYDFHFFNSDNNEGFVLSKSIPHNSFQKEDIALVPAVWPNAPSTVQLRVISAASVLIIWNTIQRLTYHIYRRNGSTLGSFFRIDDTTGNLSNRGVSGPYYVDNSVRGDSLYNYLLVPEDDSGIIGRHSNIFSVNTLAADPPVIRDIVPAVGSVTGSTPVTVNGIGFDINGSIVAIGGLPLDSLKVISPFEISGYAPASDSGAKDVVVINSASGLTSNTLLNGFTYRADAEAPAVVNVSVSDCGRTVDFSVVDAGTDVESAAFAWRKGNTPAGFLPADSYVQHISGNDWRMTMPPAVLPDDSLEAIGYEIEVTARDLIGNAGSHVISVGGCIQDDWDGGSMISAANWLEDTGQDSLWHLVTIPGYLPSNSIADIFLTNSGFSMISGTNGDSWRLYEYSEQNFKTMLPEAAIEPGRGYWFRHFGAFDTLHTDTSAAATTWPTGTPMPIMLEYGWNLIGSPFLFPVHIDEDSLSVDSVSSFLTQTSPAQPGGSNWWQAVNISGPLPALHPWQGYAIRCENPDGYTVYLNPHYQSAKRFKQFANSWSADIALSGGGVKRGQVTIGISPDARDGLDIRDVQKVTLFGNNSGLYLGTASSNQLMQDVRNNITLQKWNLEIDVNVDKNLVITWAALDLPDDNMRLMLYDAVLNHTIDMTASASYTVINPQQMPAERFSIYLGESEAVAAALKENEGALPDEFALYQNYPNPFNPATTISFDLAHSGHVTLDIFNVLGQRVARIADGWYNAGSYQVVWDGADASGTPVASGIYLYCINAGDYSDSRKMILLK